jgi:hypothetical protein
MLSLLGLMVAWKVFPWIYAPIQGLVLTLLYAGVGS